MKYSLEKTKTVRR